jgi:hypothetical protein
MPELNEVYVRKIMDMAMEYMGNYSISLSFEDGDSQSCTITFRSRSINWAN